MILQDTPSPGCRRVPKLISSALSLFWQLLRFICSAWLMHCRRAGFEPHRASSFSQEEGESPPSTRRSRPSQNTDPSLCSTLTYGGVGELYRRRSPFLGIVLLCRPPPHQDRRRARAAGIRFARDGKVPGPQLGAKQIPGERPRESAET